MITELDRPSEADIASTEKREPVQITSLTNERFKRSETTISSHVIGNKYGHDIRVTAPTLPDGRTIFDFQSSPESVDDMIEKQITIGHHTYEGYPYDVKVLSSEIIEDYPDAIGTRVVVAAAHTLGYHYANNVGTRVPKEVAWNPQHQDETRSYIRVVSNPWKPDTVTARLVRTDTCDFKRYERLYQKVQKEKEQERNGERVVFDAKALAGD